MKIKICEVDFCIAKELIDKNIFVKTDVTNIFLFGDNLVEYPTAFLDENLTYYISHDFIHIPDLEIKIHALRSECYDRNDIYADDCSYIIINSNYGYFTETEAYLDSLLENYLEFKCINCNDMSSLKCDIVLFSQD